MLRWRAFWKALGATLSLCAALWALAPPRYDTNDDVAIRLTLEGRAVPGQPGTGFVILSHAGLGWTLHGLARAWPAVPWWDLVISGLLIWAIAVFSALAWDALGREWLARATGVAALLVAILPLVTALQYTISATLAGGAALAVFVVELMSGRARRSVLAMAAALLAAATLVRPMAAMAGAVSSAVLLLPLALAHPTVPPRRGLVTLATAMTAAGALFVALGYADRWLYRFDRPWDEYARYNVMLARLFEWGGNVSGDRFNLMRAAAGWSENDWEMLPAMWGVDAGVHSFDRLRRAYEVSGAAGGAPFATVAAVVERMAVLARTELGRVFADAGYVLAAVVVVVAAYATRRGVAVAAVLIVSFFVLCLGIEAAYKTLPFRLLAPIHACLLAAALVTVASFRRSGSAVPRVLGLSLALTVLVQEATAVASAVTAGLRHMQQVEGEVAALRDLGPSLVVSHADTFPAEIWWRPFHRPAFDIPSVALGWNNQNPMLQRFLTSTGRQPLLRAICHDPSIVVIAARPDRFEPVDVYMREHFHETVAWTRLNSGSFAAWRCTAHAGTGAVSGSGHARAGGEQP
jgi:hypothetical protein